MALRGIGIDVADVDRFARLLRDRSSRFSRRWFSAEEIAECSARGNWAVAFVARFAAKEAVWKAVGLDTGPAVPWRSIAIVGGEAGTPIGVAFEGTVREQAVRAGVGAIRVEWCINGKFAVAIALVEQGEYPAA